MIGDPQYLFKLARILRTRDPRALPTDVRELGLVLAIPAEGILPLTDPTFPDPAITGEFAATGSGGPFVGSSNANMTFGAGNQGETPAPTLGYLYEQFTVLAIVVQVDQPCDFAMYGPIAAGITGGYGVLRLRTTDSGKDPFVARSTLTVNNWAGYAGFPQDQFLIPLTRIPAGRFVFEGPWVRERFSQNLGLTATTVASNVGLTASFHVVYKRVIAGI